MCTVDYFAPANEEGLLTNVVYSSGKLITHPDVVLVFIRVSPDDWTDLTFPPGDRPPPPIVCAVSTFLRDLVDSAYMDRVGAEFSQPGQQIGRGTYQGPFFLSVPPAPAARHLAPSDVLDEDIRQALLDALTANTLPPASESTLYVVMPPGEVLWAFGLTNTKPGGAAYHQGLLLTRTTLAAYCVIGQNSQASYAEVISHELVEAITDTDLNGWGTESNPRQEVADLCAVQADDLRTVSFHGHDVSTFWSPVQRQCVGPVDDTERHGQLIVKISGGISYCQGGLVEGDQTKYTLTARLDGLIEPIFKVTWGCDTQYSISADGMTITVTGPTPPGPFHLDATVVTATGCLASVHATFSSVSEAQSEWFRKLCALIAHLPHRPPVHVNPLWDPLRDLIMHPLTRPELQSIQQSADLLNQVVDQLRLDPSAHKT